MKPLTVVHNQDRSSPSVNNSDIEHGSEKDRQTQKDENDISRDNDPLSAIKVAQHALIHEIRNPLTAITLANQSLIDKKDTLPFLSTLTGIISKNISRIETILTELLQKNNSLEWRFAPVDLCDVINKSLQDADDRIFLKKIKVIKSYGFDLTINGNAEKLGIAFLNIIINAIEAVDEKGKLWITAYSTKNKINIIFKDNGIGMEPEVSNRIFEKNFSNKAGGLGIGLANVKEILEYHQANVSVHSEKGTGTIIMISFKTN